MAKPNIPNQKKTYQKLNTRLAQYVALVEEVYDTLNKEASKAALNAGYKDGSKPFRWADYPQTKQKIGDIQAQFVEELTAVINRSTSEEWKNSNETQDLVANGVLRAYGAQVKGKEYKRYYETNSDALAAFQKRKDKGMNLSARLWNQSKDYKAELEAAISCAIQKGTSAVTLSKQVSKYLLDFPSLQADYTEQFGKAANIRNCQYYSARLARTEINMAYRSAENERWKQMDFVVGQEIKTTQNGKHEEDMCDQLAGKYPKDFVWTGWHPNCYSDDTKVLTARGWLLFKDVQDTDKILSLNPDTRCAEWVGITARQQHHVSGEMIHFFNRSLDCLVTPEHRMVYLSKTSGDIRFTPAARFRMSFGAFYRGCTYDAADIANIVLYERTVNFDWYCKFMGFWLSDGCLGHANEIILSQQDGQPSKTIIHQHLEELGVNVRSSRDRLAFNDRSLYLHLRQYGKAQDKYIPQEIINASQWQIRLFLDAFSRCDGSRRKTKLFIGSHGNLFRSKREEVLYFTTSELMAGQLCELLLKVGCRPSFTISTPSTSTKKDGSEIHSNYPCYTIRECRSTTATVFGKQTVNYDGYVYDLTLERNHIMYVSRNGKCFWGSNCLCYKIPILKTEEEFWADEGESTESENSITELPEGFFKWVQSNKSRIISASAKGTLPYFIRDNQYYTNRAKRTNIPTEAERKDIQERWDERKKDYQQTIDNANTLLNSMSDDYYLVVFPSLEDTADLLKEAVDGYNIGDVKTLTAQLSAQAKAKEAALKNAAHNVLAKTAEYKDTITATKHLNDSLADNNLYNIKYDIEAVAKKLSEFKAQEKKLSTLIPDVHKWAGKFELAELTQAHDAIEKKLSYFSTFSLDKQKSKLEFEIKYVTNPQVYKSGATLYPTWKISATVYQNSLDKVNYSIGVDSAKLSLVPAKDWANTHPKSKKFIQLLQEAELSISSGETLTDIQNKVDVVIKEYTKRAKAAGIAIASSVPDKLSAGDKQHFEDMLTKFGSNTVDEMDALLRPQTKKMWAKWSEEERTAATKYTQTYSYLNERLRGLTYSGPRAYSEYVADLDTLTKALAKNKTTEDMIVRRGTNDYLIPELGKSLSKVAPGDVFVDGGFLSTAAHRNKGFFKSYDMVILVPKGSEGVFCEPFSHYTDHLKFDFEFDVLWNGKSKEDIGSEFEWIGQRGSKFVVYKKTGNTIYLKMVAQRASSGNASNKTP